LLVDAHHDRAAQVFPVAAAPANVERGKAHRDIQVINAGDGDGQMIPVMEWARVQGQSPGVGSAAIPTGVEQSATAVAWVKVNHNHAQYAIRRSLPGGVVQIEREPDTFPGREGRAFSLQTEHASHLMRAAGRADGSSEGDGGWPGWGIRRGRHRSERDSGG